MAHCKKLYMFQALGKHCRYPEKPHKSNLVRQQSSGHPLFSNPKLASGVSHTYFLRNGLHAVESKVHHRARCRRSLLPEKVNHLIGCLVHPDRFRFHQTNPKPRLEKHIFCPSAQSICLLSNRQSLFPVDVLTIHNCDRSYTEKTLFSAAYLDNVDNFCLSCLISPATAKVFSKGIRPGLLAPSIK